MQKKPKQQSNPAAKQQSGIKVYRRLLTYVWPYKGLFFISIFSFALASMTQPLFAELVKTIIDTLQTVDRQKMLNLPLLFFGLVMLRSIAGFVGGYFMARVSNFVIHNLRCEIFTRYTQLTTRYFDSNNSGYLISRITHNVNQVTQASTNALKTVVAEGLTIIGLLAYIFYINWQLSIIFLGIAPIVTIIVLKVSAKVRGLSLLLQKAVGDLTRITVEVVSGHKLVKGYGGESYEVKRFTKQSNYHRNQTMKVEIVSSIQGPVMQMIIATALSILMYYALLFIVDQSSIGEFVAYLTAAAILPRSIKLVSSAIVNIQRGIAAAQSLFEVLDEPPETDTGTKVLHDCKGEIEFRNVSFYYEKPEQMALNNISFKIQPGQTVALVGASGGGKTTLINLIMRFYNHQQGQILLDGHDISELTIKSLRQQLAIVNQDIVLFDDSVKNNIAYGSAVVDEQRILQAAQDAFAMEFVEKLNQGIDTYIGERGVRLSGGQCQRLAMARAIYKNAPMLVLDEATSALDTRSEKYIQAALERTQQGKTSFIIAHRLSTIENADVILVVDSGAIIEQGSHQELMDLKGAYAQLHKLQFKKAEAATVKA